MKLTRAEVAAAPAYLRRGWLWLTVPRDSVDWKAALDSAGSWFRLGTIASRILADVIFVLAVVVIAPRVWETYSAHLPAIIPLGAGIGGVIVAWAALTQAATARRRHEEQTKADLQRRITESFSKATEQIGSDKIEVRLGGIYTLERISRESAVDYWTVMETLCAFIRERARRRADDTSVAETIATPEPWKPTVSIRAPRAGRDGASAPVTAAAASGFDPRAPCGARRSGVPCPVVLYWFRSARPVRQQFSFWHGGRFVAFKPVRPDGLSAVGRCR